MSCKPVCNADPFPLSSTLVDYTSHALPKLVEPEPLRLSQNSLTGGLSSVARMTEPPQLRSISSAPEDLVPLPWILDPTQAHHYDRRGDSSSLSQTQHFQLSRPWVTLQAHVIHNVSFLGDSAGEQRAILEREADQIREMLQATERELAALRG